VDNVNGKLIDAGVEARVFGREKSLYSIYRKMEEKRLSFSQVLDIYGFRVVVCDIPTCYLAMGALHSLYKPVPGKFKDYIAIPKVNGYQSLHTTLIGPYGTPVEVQIRTEEMHHVAQEGVASHWLYKDSEREWRRPAGQDTQVAAVAAGTAEWYARFGRIPGARQDRSFSRRGLCVHAQGPDHGAAARGDGGGFRLYACTPTSATVVWLRASTTS
jgi:(p)ppGpp synthase/HD superfamily hydrolase